MFYDRESNASQVIIQQWNHCGTLLKIATICIGDTVAQPNLSPPTQIG